MEGHDHLPDERLGAVGMMRKRAAEVESLAEACDAEADEQEEAVQRMRQRARCLRLLAEEYISAAHMVEAVQQRRFDPADPLRPHGVYFVDDLTSEPTGIRPGDTLMVRDPVDPSTYRLHRWNEIDQRWTRSRS